MVASITLNMRSLSDQTGTWRTDFVNMNEDLLNRLAAAPVVPLVVPDDPETAIKTTQALVAGGLTVIYFNKNKFRKS